MLRMLALAIIIVFGAATVILALAALENSKFKGGEIKNVGRKDWREVELSDELD